jgi:hypothetical protein
VIKHSSDCFTVVRGGRHKAEAYGPPYVECSSKTGEGVQEAIDELVAHIAGGWRSMAFVPDDAFFDAHCGPKALRRHLSPQQQQKKEHNKCSLQ